MDMPTIIAIVEFLFLLLAASYIIRINSQQKKEGELDAINSRFDEILNQLKKSERVKSNIWKEKQQWEFKRDLYLNIINILTDLSFDILDYSYTKFNSNDGSPIPEKDQDNDRIIEAENKLQLKIKELSLIQNNSIMVISFEIYKKYSTVASELKEIRESNFKRLADASTNIDHCAHEIALLAQKELLPEITSN